MKTSRTSKLPPFYTHVIGSLPRPKVVQDLLARRDELPADRYRQTLDEMVLFAIRLQELAGIDVVSDGEWRRSHYIGEFLTRVGGFEKVRRYEHQGETKYSDVVVRRMQVAEPMFAADARFLVDHASRVTKFAFPSPFLIAVRYWHEDHSREAYPTVQRFMDHLAEILAGEARAVVEVGIDIVQLDDPALTYFCDRKLMSGEWTHDERLRRDWNIDRQFPEALAAINRVVEGLKAEVHLHCCHSVYKRQSDVAGDYKPILPRLAEAKVDRVNLEFAYPKTGDASDLALLPAHLGVGMGVVDVRSEELQSVEAIEQLAAAGAEYVAPQRIALNPDCGFAPGAGEPPTIDEAFEKLKRLSAAAERVRKRFSAVLSCILLAATCAVSSPQHVVASDIEKQSAAIAAAGPQGQGAKAAQQAAAELSQGSVEVLTQLLDAMDTPNIVAANFARTAFDDVVARELTKPSPQFPLDTLRSYVKDSHRAGRARRLVLKLVDRFEPQFGKDLVPTLLDDPEFRSDAVAATLAAGGEAEKTGDKQAALVSFRKAFGHARDAAQITAAAAALKRNGQPVDVARHMGFVTRWWLLGPFNAPGMSGFAQAFPPEHKVDLEATYEMQDLSKKRWRQYEITDELGQGNLVEAIGPVREAVAAAFTQLRERFETRHGRLPGARHYIRVLQLLAEHPLARVEQAIQACRGDGVVTAERIAGRCERLAALSTRDELTGQDARSRSVSAVQVPLPDLRRFDSLLSHGGEDHGPQRNAPVAAIEPQGAAAADDAGRVWQARRGGGRQQPGLPRLSAATDGVGAGHAQRQRLASPDQTGRLPGPEGSRSVRL